MAKRVPWKSPSKPWNVCSPEDQAALQALWLEGELDWKLTKSQQDSRKKIKKWLKQPPELGRRYALDISRRWGKSALLCELALELGFQNPGWRMVYLAPTHEMVRKIVIPLMSLLTQDCKPVMAPVWNKSEGYYEFHNGARLEVIGLDVRPDGARGTGVDMVFLDEAGFFQNLEYLVNSVVAPQMLGRPHARIIAASTPPVSPSHYWSEHYVPDCVNKGAHDIKTLDDADQYSEAEIEEFYAAMPGGRNGVAARREYGAQHIADETLMILPEFRDAEKDRFDDKGNLVWQGIVREVEAPLWRDCYVAMDPGYHDMTAVLFGYWDFGRRKLVIEDELAASRLNSWEVAQGIKRKEKELWGKLKRRGHGPDGMRPQPYMRVSDNDPRLLADLSSDHGLTFIATKKDNLVQQVDAVRVAIQRGDIEINPRCRKLILHCKNGVWKKTGSVFANEGGSFGHFDCIAALVYMWRNLVKSRNPEPALVKMVMPDIPAQVDRPGPKSKWAQRGTKFFLKTGRS